MLQEMVLIEELDDSEWVQYNRKWESPYGVHLDNKLLPIRTRAFSGDGEIETMNYFDYLINLRDSLNYQCGSDRYCIAYKRAVGNNILVREVEQITLMERVYKEEEIDGE